MKPYFTDALAAAWMAKYFGVKFLGNNPLVGNDWAKNKVLYYEAEKYYIHPDSLPIFEPQEGDVVSVIRKWELKGALPKLKEVIKSDTYGRIVRTGYADYKGVVWNKIRKNAADINEWEKVYYIDPMYEWYGDEDIQIIQRNGLPFLDYRNPKIGGCDE